MTWKSIGEKGRRIGTLYFPQILNETLFFNTRFYMKIESISLNLNLFSLVRILNCWQLQPFRSKRFGHHQWRNIMVDLHRLKIFNAIYLIQKFVTIPQTEIPTFSHYFWVRCTFATSRPVDWVLDFAAITTFARYMQTAYRFRQTSTKNSGASVCIF